MTLFLVAVTLGLDPGTLAERFPCEVTSRLHVPAEEQAFYIKLVNTAYGGALGGNQYLLVVDRNPHVQAAFLLFRTATGDTTWIGATPVSTGRPGAFEYFATPVGIFPHTTANLDFRAEGTQNKNGIRGYGLKGMRVFDFGWVKANKGWGNGGESLMRLQVHATDPDRLEPNLGIPLSKGCIRVPATLNTFLDRYALLDADYAAAGHPFFVLRPDRTPAPWPGRDLLVLDSQRTARPVWSPKPNSPLR